ncbi:MAG: hypothetical protein UZ22_OP11002000408 [Microgenomates bacterium OLB23]|nr:MAG: hypothetical protein UZ22_OP11002000408 [Microgenomates bacterium OLB23]
MQADTPIALLSEASNTNSAAYYCPVDITLYVHEQDTLGQQVPLSLESYPELDLMQWSITTNNAQSAPLYFNELPLMQYSAKNTFLSLVTDPKQADMFAKKDVAALQLNYQSDLFRVVKQEVVTCASATQQNLCNTQTEDESNNQQQLTTLSATMDCGMKLVAGWVVEKVATNTSPSSATTATTIVQCDLNSDGACNTFDLFVILDTYGSKGSGLNGDLNNDQAVNALDYTLMTSRISLL